MFGTSMFILIRPHVRHFSGGKQTVCPTLKNKLWPPIIPKQRERERFGLIFFIVIEFLNPVEKKRFTSVMSCPLLIIINYRETLYV
jgi:hypothetical protein